MQWVIPDLLPTESLIIVAGAPKRSRKTYTLMHLAHCLATGQAFCGDERYRPQATASAVVYSFLEDGYPRAVRRWRSLGFPADDTYPVSFTVDPEGWWYAYECYIPAVAQQGFRGTWVMDPLVRLEHVMGIEDENDPIAISAMLSALQQRARQWGWTFVVPHHYRKADARMRGSTAIEGEVDGWWDMAEVRPGIVQVKSTLRDGPEQELYVQVAQSETTGAICFTAAEAASAQKSPREQNGALDMQIAGEICEFLRGASGPQSQNKVCLGVHRNNRRVRDTLMELQAKGFVENRKHGPNHGYVWIGETVSPEGENGAQPTNGAHDGNGVHAANNGGLPAGNGAGNGAGHPVREPPPQLTNPLSPEPQVFGSLPSEDGGEKPS